MNGKIIPTSVLRARWTDESLPDYETASTTPYSAVWVKGENAGSPACAGIGVRNALESVTQSFASMLLATLLPVHLRDEAAELCRFFGEQIVNPSF